MNPAKDNVFRAGLSGLPRELERVARQIGVTEYLITLVVVAKNDTAVAQFFLGGRDSGFAFGLVQQGVIFQSEGVGKHGVRL